MGTKVCRRRIAWKIASPGYLTSSILVTQRTRAGESVESLPGVQIIPHHLPVSFCAETKVVLAHHAFDPSRSQDHFTSVVRICSVVFVVVFEPVGRLLETVHIRVYLVLSSRTVQ